MAKSAAKAASSPGFDPWLSSQRLFPPYVWPEVFGRTAPVELDLGAGDGVYVEARAHREPDRDFVAVERLLGRATKTAKKAVRGGLRNLRILRLESAYFLKNLCAPGSVDGITLRYPDPWPKRRHHGNRILTRDFAADAARALRKGGRFQCPALPDTRQGTEHVPVSPAMSRLGMAHRPKYLGQSPVAGFRSPLALASYRT